jgi:hypothetical protein
VAAEAGEDRHVAGMLDPLGDHAVPEAPAEVGDQP